jgi:FtsH-binding integral membrane protein
MSPTPRDDTPVRRIDRILAFMSLGLLALAIVCFFAILIGRAVGADTGSGVWPAASLTTYIAPIVAFILIFVLLVMSFVRRGRAAKGR